MNNTDIISLALVAVTLGLVWFTYVLAQETRRLRVGQTEPHVTTYVDTRNDFPVFMLYIKNDGFDHAYDIKINVVYPSDVSNDSVSEIKEKISSIPAILNGMKFLPKNSEFKYYLISPFGHLENLRGLVLNMTTTYSNSYGETFSCESVVDFSCYDKKALDTNYIHKITESVESIAKSFGKIAGFNGEMNVVVKSSKEKEREEQESLKEAEKYFEEQKRKSDD